MIKKSIFMCLWAALSLLYSQAAFAASDYDQKVNAAFKEVEKTKTLDQVYEEHQAQDTSKSVDDAQVEHQEYYDGTEEEIEDIKEEMPEENVEWNGNDESLSAVKPLTLDLGAEAYYYHYEEESVDVEHNGFMYGVNGAVTYRSNDLFYSPLINLHRLEGRYAMGEIDYEGSGTIDGIDDFFYEGRGILGKEVALSDSTLMAYAGFGYRFVNDDGSGHVSSTNAYGYEREDEYYYVPIGVELKRSGINTWDTIINLEYDLFLKGIQRSFLARERAGNTDLKFNQEDGYGARGSIRFLKSTDPLNVWIEPFVRVWQIDDSQLAFGTVDNATGFYVEPENQTVEAGVKAGLQF